MKDRDYYINKYLQMGTEYLNVDLTCIVPKLVNEMMTELEAISSLQLTRSCDGCKNCPKVLSDNSPFCHIHNFWLTAESAKILSCNKYEAKENE